MVKNSKTAIMGAIAIAGLALTGLISEASADIKAYARTDRAQYGEGDKISTEITLDVSEDVMVDLDFFQEVFEHRLDVRDPEKNRLTHNDFGPGQPAELEPKPAPPGKLKKLLKAGKYKVILENLAEHFAISQLGEYRFRFVLPLRTYDANGNPTEHIISSKIDKFEIVKAGLVGVDVDPDTLSLKSKRKWVTAYISAFPGAYTAEDVIIDSVKLWHNGTSVSADWGNVQGDVLMVKFNGTAVQNMLSPAEEIELELTGEFANSNLFKGSDTIRVIEAAEK